MWTCIVLGVLGVNVDMYSVESRVWMWMWRSIVCMAGLL